MDNETKKPCRHCSELILQTAKVCKHCNRYQNFLGQSLKIFLPTFLPSILSIFIASYALYISNSQLEESQQERIAANDAQRKMEEALQKVEDVYEKVQSAGDRAQKAFITPVN